jgi:hypothetical protein
VFLVYEVAERVSPPCIRPEGSTVQGLLAPTFLARQISPGSSASFFRLIPRSDEVALNVRSTSHIEISTSLPARANDEGAARVEQTVVRGDGTVRDWTEVVGLENVGW